MKKNKMPKGALKDYETDLGNFLFICNLCKFWCLKKYTFLECKK